MIAPFNRADGTQGPSGMDSPVTWVVDTRWSRVSFSASHRLEPPVSGRIMTVQGTIDVDLRDLLGSTVDVEAELAIDSEAADQASQDLPTLPVLGFRSRFVERTEDEHFRVLGDMAIGGVVRAVELAMVESGRGVDADGTCRVRLAAATRLELSGLPGLERALSSQWGLHIGQAVEMFVEVDVVEARAA
jgi:polyisoprenoid-binding protein YceI